MSRTNAPWDTMLHLSWLGCEPARCLSGADSSGRWALGTDADCVRFSAADGFRYDAHVDMRRETQRQTRPRRRSKAAGACSRSNRHLSLVLLYHKGRLDTPHVVCMHGLVTGQPEGVLLAYAMEGAVQDESCAGSAIDRPRC